MTECYVGVVCFDDSDVEDERFCFIVFFNLYFSKSKMKWRRGCGSEKSDGILRRRFVFLSLVLEVKRG